MMFIKRQLAIVVMMVMGFLGLSGYFINWQTLRDFTEKAENYLLSIINGNKLGYGPSLIKSNLFVLSNV